VCVFLSDGDSACGRQRGAMSSVAEVLVRKGDGVLSLLVPPAALCAWAMVSSLPCPRACLRCRICFSSVV